MPRLDVFVQTSTVFVESIECFLTVFLSVFRMMYKHVNRVCRVRVCAERHSQEVCALTYVDVNKNK